MNNYYYISLCRGLSGYYVMVGADNEDIVRKYAEEYYGKVWCKIYTAAYFHEILKRRYPKGSKVVNSSAPIELGNSYKYE